MDGSDKPAADLVFSEVSRASWGENWYPTVKGDMQSLTDARYHYIKNGDGREELYDLDHDAAGKKDIARSAEGRGLLDQICQGSEALPQRRTANNETVKNPKRYSPQRRGVRRVESVF